MNRSLLIGGLMLLVAWNNGAAKITIQFLHSLYGFGTINLRYNGRNPAIWGNGRLIYDADGGVMHENITLNDITLVRCYAGYQ